MRKIRSGEIGCTLSHQKCYRKIIENGLPYALILEDDLLDGADFDALTRLLEPLLRTSEPRIILLSGDFWWLTSRPIDATHRLARLFDGYMAHSYLINQAGARRIISDRPGYIADDWRYLIHKGLHIYGLLPHAVNQDRSGTFTSSINQSRPERLDTAWLRFWSRIRREPFKNLRKKLLRRIGHYEPI